MSHDLQTPITRMKLRAEMAEDSEEKRKMVSDLSEIQTLLQQGLAYVLQVSSDVRAPLST